MVNLNKAARVDAALEVHSFTGVRVGELAAHDLAVWVFTYVGEVAGEDCVAGAGVSTCGGGLFPAAELVCPVVPVGGWFAGGEGFRPLGERRVVVGWLAGSRQGYR